MVRSLPELQKPVWYSEDSVQMSGSEMGSSLTPSSQGGQKKRFKDTLKASLKDFDILTGSWEQRYQRNEVSSTKEQPSMKKREPVKLEENTENAKPIPIGQQLIS